MIEWPTIIGALMLLVVIAGIAGKLIQNQFASVTAREAEIKASISQIHTEMERRRQEFVHQDEFRQVQKMADDRWNTQAEINRQAVDAYLSTKAWETWRQERDRLIGQIMSRIDGLEKP